MSEARCGLCGEPMPPGEEMFNYHGYSGPCPKVGSVPVSPSEHSVATAQERSEKIIPSETATVEQATKEYLRCRRDWYELPVNRDNDEDVLVLYVAMQQAFNALIAAVSAQSRAGVDNTSQAKKGVEPECAKCHKPLALLDGHEWPEDMSLVLCSSCSIDEIRALRAVSAQQAGEIRVAHMNLKAMIKEAEKNAEATRALAAQLAELQKLINDDGSLTTFEEHRDILTDAMHALNQQNVLLEREDVLRAQLAEQEREIARLRQEVRRLSSHPGIDPFADGAVR